MVRCDPVARSRVVEEFRDPVAFSRVVAEFRDPVASVVRPT
jgi:hypothetical protein